MTRKSFFLLTLCILVLVLSISAQTEEDCVGDDCDEPDIEAETATVEGHKPFWPLEPIEYLATFFLVIIIMLTNAAGVGGGGAILPILLMYGFTANVAVALANTIIFVGAVTRFGFEFSASHPEKKAKLIDYSIVILMLPAVMVGSFIGAQLNTIAPQAALLFTLGAVLCFVSFKSTRKAIELYRKEQEDMPKNDYKEVAIPLVPDNDNVSIDSEEIGEVEMQNLEGQNSSNNSIVIRDRDSRNTQALKRIKADERTHFQWKKLLIIFLGYIALVLVSLIRQNQFNSFLPWIEKYSILDICICLVFMIFCTSLLLTSVQVIKNEYALKKTVNYEFIKGDIQWENSIIVKMSFIAIFGGMLASLVGLGGGVIYNPLMLEFGVHPRIAGSTSMYLVLLGTLAATTQYIFMDILPYDYAFALGCIIVVSVLVGNLTLSSVVKKMGRPSAVAILLAAVIILCTIIVLTTSVVKVVQDSG